jgi:hypothetical protein
MSAPSIADAATLTRWFDDAQHALDTADTLTEAHIRALVAQPTGTGRATKRVTWWLEAAEMAMKERAFDPRPRGDDVFELRQWQARQDRAQERIEGLLDAHAEALVQACGAPKVARAKSRPDAAERALAARRAQEAA